MSAKSALIIGWLWSASAFGFLWLMAQMWFPQYLSAYEPITIIRWVETIFACGLFAASLSMIVWGVRRWGIGK
jgi:hypothetical protein